MDALDPSSDSASNTIETPVLIIGAGPFGLSLAAYLGDLGNDYVLAGNPMSFWRDHMPAGMLLRSGLDWHLDARDEATLMAFVADSGLDEDAVLPLSRNRYLDYVAWFMRRKHLQPVALQVERLTRGEDGRLVAACGDTTVIARSVVVATGFRDYASRPDYLFDALPPDRYGHTCEVVDLAAFHEHSMLIVGGRQSAFESAALLAEAGARSVDVVYRHDTPRFEPSDWSWVGPLMQRTQEEPGWYRALSEAERRDIDARFWAEGRLKLEPWLAPRIDAPNVRLWPNDRISSVEADPGGLNVHLAGGGHVESDYILLATGYKVDVTRLPFLARDGNLLSAIEAKDGYPVLDAAMQSSVDGLYFTSIAATQDFGAFFAFTVSARCSARLIGDSVSRR